ncbi:MAG TPA: hypothetical protein VGG39_28930 [Polyangiaceae bacterium]|jgi:hypothetical protein
MQTDPPLLDPLLPPLLEPLLEPAPEHVADVLTPAMVEPALFVPENELPSADTVRLSM